MSVKWVFMYAVQLDVCSHVEVATIRGITTGSRIRQGNKNYERQRPMYLPRFATVISRVHGQLLPLLGRSSCAIVQGSAGSTDGSDALPLTCSVGFSVSAGHRPGSARNLRYLASSHWPTTLTSDGRGAVGCIFAGFRYPTRSRPETRTSSHRAARKSALSALAGRISSLQHLQRFRHRHGCAADDYPRFWMRGQQYLHVSEHLLHDDERIAHVRPP